MGNENKRRQTSDLLDTAKRRAFVLCMRKAGSTYPEIAAAAVAQFGSDQLPNGWDERYAYKDIQRELDKLRREIGDTAEDLRQLELQRLDDLLKAVWPLAARPTPDYRAFDRVLKLMDRRAKLLGLDAPNRTEHTGADGGPIQTESVNATRERLLADLQAAMDDDAAAGPG